MGVEAPITPHSSVKVEYLYANFGWLSDHYGKIRNDLDCHIVRVRLNFGFLNWRAAIAAQRGDPDNLRIPKGEPALRTSCSDCY